MKKLADYTAKDLFILICAIVVGFSIAKVIATWIFIKLAF